MPKFNLNPIGSADLLEYLSNTSEFSFELQTQQLLRAEGLECDRGGLYEERRVLSTGFRDHARGIR